MQQTLGLSLLPVSRRKYSSIYIYICIYIYIYIYIYVGPSKLMYTVLLNGQLDYRYVITD